MSRVSCLEFKACLLDENDEMGVNLQLRSCTKNLELEVVVPNFILTLVSHRSVAFLVAPYALLDESGNTNYSCSSVAELNLFWKL